MCCSPIFISINSKGSLGYLSMSNVLSESCTNDLLACPTRTGSNTVAVTNTRTTNRVMREDFMFISPIVGPYLGEGKGLGNQRPWSELSLCQLTNGYPAVRVVRVSTKKVSPVPLQAVAEGNNLHREGHGCELSVRAVLIKDALRLLPRLLVHR